MGLMEGVSVGKCQIRLSVAVQGRLSAVAAQSVPFSFVDRVGQDTSSNVTGKGKHEQTE